MTNLSIADLNARKAGETPHEFEYLLPDGTATGVFLSVLGAQSPRVSGEINRLINERRRQQAAAEAQPVARGADAAFVTVESDQDFNQKLAAVRLAGWTGLDDAFTPETAIELCRVNQDVADQVIQRSNNVTNFIRLSRKP